MVAALLMFTSLLAPPAPSDFPIGFVCHYPMVHHEDDSLDDTGANVVIVRAPWALIEPENDRYDFAMLDDQLEWADRNDLLLVYVMEAGPAHAAGVKWLVEELQAAGDTMADRAGHAVPDPSIFSERYRRHLSDYLRAVTHYLASHKLSDRVLGYDNGCEWWYLNHLAYGPLDQAAFRRHLQERHGSIRSLNDRWGTQLANFGEVTAPELDWDNMGFAPQGVLVPQSATLDACYCTQEGTHVPVRPGQAVRLEVDYTTRGVRAGRVSAELAWLDGKNPPPVKIDRAFVSVSGDSQGTVTLEATAPENAALAWLLPKSLAVGTVTLTGVRLIDDQGNQLATNPTLDPAAGGWQFILWSAGSPDRVSHGWDGPGDAWIRYEPDARLAGDPAFPLAVVYDWLRFRDTEHARFIDWMAEEIKGADPDRPIVTYLTFAFANAFEWDYAEHTAMRLDDIAHLGKHLDVLGMQLASAEGDYDSVTGGFDLVRKYGKPMWAVDLLDFTRGVALGADGNTRLSSSVVQHGGSGIQYYCWFGTEHYNYAERGQDELARMIGDTKAMAAAIGTTRPRADVALIMPKMAPYAFPPEPLNSYADFMGWYKLLVRAGVCPDLYTLEELERADLRHYRAVVVPDCAYGTPEALGALRRASGAGVPIVASGRQFVRDMTGRPLDAERPAAAAAFAAPVGAAWLGETYRCPTISNTPSRLVCTRGEPDWSHPAVAQALAALRDAGVPVLLTPGERPLTAVPLQDGRAFILPTTDGIVRGHIGARSFEAGPAGSLTPVR